MRARLLVIFLALTGCLQTENSSSLDGADYDLTGSAEFVAAKAVFSANCNGPCHRHGFHLDTEAELIAQGLVVAGNAEGSKIYYRNVGSAGSGGPKNMPEGSSALTSTDLEVIATWINGITP